MQSNNEGKNDAFMVIFEVLQSNESSENLSDRLASSSFYSLVLPNVSCTFSRIGIAIFHGTSMFYNANILKQKLDEVYMLLDYLDI